MSNKTVNPVLSIRDQILALTAKVSDKPISLKGINGDVFVKILSAREREEIEPDFAGDQSKNKMRAMVFQKTICDKDGNLLFTKADVDALAELQFGIINEGFTKSNILNGIDVESVDEAEKNS